MGDIASSHSATQKTENFQSGSDNGGVSSSVRSTGKGSSFAAGSGISLVLNTGGNKVAASKSNPAKSKPAINATAPASLASHSNAPSAPDNQATNGSGGIKVNISQTDQGAVQAGTDVSLAALDAIKSANEGVVKLAGEALQTGADVAAVAVPTYAAAEIASGAIQQPPEEIISGGDSSGIAGNKLYIGLSAIGIALSLALILKKKPA